METTSHEPQPADATSNGLPDHVEPEEQAAPSVTAYRRDGWTPFARKLFLEVLAETGRVSRACEYAQMSVTSAYALRHRDSVFAASWDAACELARTALADALYERALDGTTETITRNGEVIAERHRHDSRLSIAVLNRLDKRCDRAAELGARHLAIIDKWEEWLALVGKGAETDAAALLDLARSSNSADLQLPQLPLGGNPIDAETEAEEIDLSHRFRETWRDGEKVWMTDFPPPADFTGYESCDWGDPDETYERECTPEEAAILEADAARAKAAERAEEDQLRDEWLALLKAESAEEAAEEA